MLLPICVTDYYLFPRLLDDGDNWVGVARLVHGRARIVRGKLSEPDSIGDAW